MVRKKKMLTIQKRNISKKFYVLFSAVIALMLLHSQVASAYVDYKLLSVSAETQQQSNWCWAAVTDMIAKFFGANSSQTDIVTYVKGSLVNETGTVYDMQKGLSKYRITSTPITTTLGFASVISEINNGQPIGTVIAWSSGGGHAHVIRGYYEDTSNSTQNLYYIDPLDASYNIMSYSNYLSNSSFHWVNTLHAIFVG
jgi:ABC-type dipeptide/oligopeptide/nickel transport system permease component